MMMYLTHEAALAFLLRVILGLLFFFQGYDKVFNVKISGVINFFREEMRHKKVPDVILVSSAYFTCLVELICGGLLIIGFFKTWALYLLGLDLILVSAAFSLLKPMWDMQMVYPRLIILSACLYLPAAWDIFSMDHFLK
jgi:uncharacterized membrane protein YphA (DoxX/SURF4 family)